MIWGKYPIKFGLGQQTGMVIDKSDEIALFQFAVNFDHWSMHDIIFWTLSKMIYSQYQQSKVECGEKEI
jgi:hypothetical protein